MNKSLFYRSYEIKRAAVDEDARSVDVSFSSETPVRRWFGDEYLLHGKGNVDLIRLKTMGSALLNHNPSIIVGAVENPRIDDKRGMASVVFDDDDDGNRAFGKVKSGSLKGISVGYQVQKFRDVTEDEEYELDDGRKIKGPAMVALRWAPYEISFTPIPADSTVGVGREETRSLDGILIEHKPQHNQEKKKMERDEALELIRAEVKEALGGLKIPTVEEIAAALNEEKRVSYAVEPDVAQDLLGRAQAISPDCRSKIADMIVSGKTENEMLREITSAQPQADTRDDGGDTNTPDGSTPPPNFDSDALVRSLKNPNMTIH